MVEIYTFDYETLIEDLLDNGCDEDEVNVKAAEILNELRNGKMIEHEGLYIIGAMTALLLEEKYNVQSCEEQLF